MLTMPLTTNPPITLYFLEGRKVITQPKTLMRRISKLFLENPANHLVFIVPTLREYFEQMPQLGRLKPSIGDLIGLLAELKREIGKEAPELTVQEVDILLDAQVEFYSLSPSLPYEEEDQEIYLEFLRLFHPLSTTSIAAVQEGGATHGYLYIEVTPNFFRWIWLGRETIARVLELVASMRNKKLLEQINVLAPSDAEP